jgi:hypothetical protein
MEREPTKSRQEKSMFSLIGLGSDSAGKSKAKMKLQRLAFVSNSNSVEWTYYIHIKSRLLVPFFPDKP